jgi:hypothetical protein
MTAKIAPLAEISHKATDILIREMGIVDTIRFLSQFRYGCGDYTAERSRWLDTLSLGQITAAIKSQRSGKEVDE